VSFEGFAPGLPPEERCRLEAGVSQVWPHLTGGYWAVIAQQADDANERALLRDPADVAHVEYLQSRLCGRRVRRRSHRMRERA
jgi:hypothetical protein